MVKNVFKHVAATDQNPKWEQFIARLSPLYTRNDDVRSLFARDYTRILHSLAYRRLKHKTQVFFNIDNDHICTRMEHVAHVESVSSTIAKYLGLNDELTKAIANGHDLGHAPFGHQGERVIRTLSKEHLKKDFWHEQNGLRFVDDIELLADNYNIFQNLNLTYAVRDGIIAHCGEVDENSLVPRADCMDLSEFSAPGRYQPVSWEGCVVKIADKIAYLGRDIEDAISLGFLDAPIKQELLEMARSYDVNAINTTVIMHNLIIDICQNSTPDKGICLSSKCLQQINAIKKFNYRYIYKHERFMPFTLYSELIINQLFQALLVLYDGKHTWSALENQRKRCPGLIQSFERWLATYCNPKIVPSGELQQHAFACANKKIYGSLETAQLYIQAILDYISGMTDRFAVKAFNEMLAY